MFVQGMVLYLSLSNLSKNSITISFLEASRATVGWLYVTQLRTRSRGKRSRLNLERFSRELIIGQWYFILHFGHFWMRWSVEKVRFTSLWWQVFSRHFLCCVESESPTKDYSVIVDTRENYWLINSVRKGMRMAYDVNC